MSDARRVVLWCAAPALCLCLSAGAHARGPEAHSKLVVVTPALSYVDGWLARQQQSSAERWTKNDAERLRAEMAGEFSQALFEGLAERIGFERANEMPEHSSPQAGEVQRGPIVRVMVTEFDPHAPNHPRNSRTAHFASTEVSATITLEFVDAATGSVLHSIREPRREGHSENTLRRSTRNADRQAMRRLGKYTADLLVRELARVPNKAA